MVGIHLAPFVHAGVLGVNVVTKRLFLAPLQVRSFPLKSRVRPILVECHRVRNTHGVYEVLFAFTRLRPSPYHPVANLCDAPNSWLAGCQGADAEERIRCKAVVSGYDI